MPRRQAPARKAAKPKPSASSIPGPAKRSRGTAAKTTALAHRAPEQVLRLGIGNPKLQAELAKAFELTQDAQASSTRDAYKSDREHWFAYAREREIQPFPISPEYLAAYVVSMNEQEYAVTTIRRRCAALSRWHRDEGQLSPTANDAFRELIRGLVRRRRQAPTKKRPITGEMVARALVDRSFDLRDRAVLAVGFSTGMRRSEIAALLVGEAAEQRSGDFVLTIARSKVDQEGKGQQVVVCATWRPASEREEETGDPRLCPATLLRQWLVERDADRKDSLFGICDRTVAAIVKRAVILSNEDPRIYSAHSMRSGMIVTAGSSPNATAMQVQQASRHVRGDQTAAYYSTSDTLQNMAFRASASGIQQAPNRRAPTAPARKPARKR